MQIAADVAVTIATLTPSQRSMVFGVLDLVQDAAQLREF
jgi:hypothetical protein